MATQNELKQKMLRDSIVTMLNQNKSPNFVRYAHWRNGFDVADVDNEIGTYALIKNDLPLPSKKTSRSTATTDENGNTVFSQLSGSSDTPISGRFSDILKPISQRAINSNPLDINQSDLTDSGKLTYNYGTRMYQSGNIISKLENNIGKKGLLDSIGQAAEEKMAGGTLTGRFVSPEFQQFDQAQRDFLNAVLRKESGAVISDQEFDNAKKQYFPVPGDDQKTIEQKRRNRELATRNFLDATGVNTNQLFNQSDQGIESQQGMNIQNQPQQPVPTVQGALEWARSNPNNPTAKKIMEAHTDGKLQSIIDQKAKQIQSQFQPQTQSNQGVGQSSQQPPYGTDEKSLQKWANENPEQFDNWADKQGWSGQTKDRIVNNPLSRGLINNAQAQTNGEQPQQNNGQGFFTNIADKVGEFMGMKKFGQGIGSAIYFATQEGKDLLKRADEGDKSSIEAVNEILKDTPNAKEILGSAGMTALNIIMPGASKGAPLFSKVVGGATAGYAFDVANKLQENKPIDEAMQPGMSTLVGGSLPIIGKGLGVGKNIVKNISSYLSGVPTEALEYAFSKPQETGTAIKRLVKNDDDIISIVNKAKQGLNNMIEQRNNNYEKALEQIPQNVTLNLNKFNNTVQNTLKKFNISTTNGVLDFTKTPLPKTQQNEIVEILDRIQKWDDFTPKGVNTLKQITDSYFRGSADSKPFDKIITTMSGSLKDYLSKEVPQIAEMNAKYSKESEFINQLVKELSLGKNHSPSTALNKLTSIFRNNNAFKQKLVERLGKETGQQVLDEIVGSMFTDWFPRGLSSRIISNLGGSMVGTAGAGYLAGGLLGAVPGAAVGGLMASPRFAGSVSTGLGKLSQRINKLPVDEMGRISKTALMDVLSSSEKNSPDINQTQAQSTENNLNQTPIKQPVIKPQATPKPKQIELNSNIPQKELGWKTGEMSAYTPSKDETDSTPNITASGKQITKRMVASNYYPFGTEVEIKGMGKFVVEDVMNKRYGGKNLDLVFLNKQEAKKFGRKNLEYQVVKWGDRKNTRSGLK